MSSDRERQDIPPPSEVAHGVAQLRAELASAQLLASQSDAKAFGLEAELVAMRSRQFAENASAQELASRFEVKATGLEAELASACSHIQTLQESMKGAVGAEDALRLSQQYEEARRLLEGDYRKAVESMQRDQAAERAMLEDRVLEEH